MEDEEAGETAVLQAIEDRRVRSQPARSFQGMARRVMARQASERRHVRAQPSLAQDLLEQIKETPTSASWNASLQAVDAAVSGSFRRLEDSDPALQPLLSEESTEYGTGHLPTTTSPAPSSRLSRRRRWRAAIRRFLFDVWQRAQWLLWALPFTVTAAVLFYQFDNPEIDALPGTAKLSWWCNFAARQIVMLGSARIIEFLFLDCLVVPSPLTGPWATLAALQFQGAPFVMAMWGLLDLILLHGDNTFQKHWLYWTGWTVFSDHADSGSYILNTSAYYRVLLCLLVAGLCLGTKRTWLAVVFGRKQYHTFKCSFEKILADVVLLADVAILAANAETIRAEQQSSKVDVARVVGSDRPNLGSVQWNTSTKDVYSGSKEEEDFDGALERKESNCSGHGRHHHLVRSSSGSFRIKSLLDRWEEPVGKGNKSSDVTIEDVLRFRRALAFMDEVYPFGENFGPAETRDQCIESAHAVFHKVAKLSSGADDTKEPVLKFEVLEMLTVDQDGTEDEKKLAALRKLFRPGYRGFLTLLMFVQNCDSLYRRYRYFRASVSNSAALDQVLEGIANGFFYFVLGLLLLSLLEYNPWSLLVSVTSLLVSFSFAFGATVSRYVQGIILIAVTRPFDLGDRIFLTPSSDVQLGFEYAGQAWFVEDITLSTTKLRYAKTGEVAYMSNHLLTDMKIYNCNRSPVAMVVFELVLHLCILDSDNLDKFKAALEGYVRDHPRWWDSFLFMRGDMIDVDNEQVTFTIAFRHRNGWQDFPRVKRHRAELLRFMFDTAEKLEVSNDTPPSRRLLYYGGVLRDGSVGETYKKGLLRPDNIHSPSDSHIPMMDMSGEPKKTV